MKLHKIILLLILLSGFSIEIPAQNSLQNEIGKVLEYDTLKRDMVKTKHLDHINISDTSSVSCANYLFRVKEPLYILLSLIISLWEWKWRKFRDNWNVN